MAGEDRRLIELPFAQAPWVERHRNQRVKCDACQTWVGESLALDLRKHTREPHFAIVFQAVNQIANRMLTACDCHSAEERELLATTVRANEIGGHTVVGLRASFATRGLHALDSSCAIDTPIPTFLHPPATVGAVSREK